MVSLISSEELQENKCRVIIHADTKAEVTNNMSGADVPEIPDSVTFAPFSIAITSSFEVAIMSSNGVWNWK